MNPGVADAVAASAAIAAGVDVVVAVTPAPVDVVRQCVVDVARIDNQREGRRGQAEQPGTVELQPHPRAIDLLTHIWLGPDHSTGSCRHGRLRQPERFQRPVELVEALVFAIRSQGRSVDLELEVARRCGVRDHDALLDLGAPHAVDEIDVAPDALVDDVLSIGRADEFRLGRPRAHGSHRGGVQAGRQRHPAAPRGDRRKRRTPGIGVAAPDTLESRVRLESMSRHAPVAS